LFQNGGNNNYKNMCFYNFFHRDNFIIETLEHIGNNKIHDENNNDIELQEIIECLNNIYFKKKLDKFGKCKPSMLKEYLPIKYLKYYN